MTWALRTTPSVIFTTDNGAEVFTWPDGGMTPFRGAKGSVLEGAFRVPCIIRWPGHVKPGTVENGIFSGLDWFPTLVAAAGNPNITDQLLKGVKLGDRTYKNHLDGYNQMALLEGKGPSARREIFYFGGPELGAVRIDNFKYQFYDQPSGWTGPKVTLDWPTLYNIRQDPFERAPIQNIAEGAPAQFNEFYGREIWRFVGVQEVVIKLGDTAVDYPPMQAPASFNLTTVKEKIQATIKAHQGD
jgi:arylsulfatase A-like enzyme